MCELPTVTCQHSTASIPLIRTGCDGICLEPPFFPDFFLPGIREISPKNFVSREISREFCRPYLITKISQNVNNNLWSQANVSWHNVTSIFYPLEHNGIHIHTKKQQGVPLLLPRSCPGNSREQALHTKQGHWPRLLNLWQFFPHFSSKQGIRRNKNIGHRFSYLGQWPRFVLNGKVLLEKQQLNQCNSGNKHCF